MAIQDQRPRFYESQYLGADDMNAVVDYGHLQLGRHELGAHIFGIAMGLYLVETATPGAPSRCNVTLVPGMAIDGYARDIVALTRDLLPESLFANIAYDATVDNPAANGGTPPGRFVKVWLEYDETNARSPAPGFERCDAGDAFTRVQETYRFVIGDEMGADLHGRVSIAGQTVAPDLALKAFDAGAGVIHDETVPHQQLPIDNAAARWLIPIGWVRWVARAAGGGYFVDRNIVATDKGDDRNRRLRRYIGLPTETIQAVDGALVLRNRTDAPDAPGRFQARLQSGDPIAATLRDLVWVEGNLRAVGDIRLAGSALRLADLAGSDRGTPLSLERGGEGASAGGRILRAVIGPDAQTDNRFAVSTVLVDDPDPALRTFDERFTVMSGGNVGVGQPAPVRRLHVKGDAVRLESADGAKRLELRSDGTQVDVQSTTSDLYIRSSDGAPAHNIVMNPFGGDGNVGIGTAPAAAYKLDVKASAIKLGLEGAGGGQLILKNNPGDNKIFLEAFSSDGTGQAAEMLLTGKDATNAPLISIRADTTCVGGNLGVGTSAPAAKVHVVGDRLLLSAAGGAKAISLFTSGSLVDLYTDSCDLSIRSAGHNCLINWMSGDGNVGIGTATPGDKLHVGGPFLQVGGLSGEQAVLGSEQSGAVVCGTRNPAVSFFDVRNLSASFSSTSSAAWLNVWCKEVHEVSDARAKTGVKDLSGALDRIARLRGVSFEWKDGPAEGQTPTRLGLIAQEVQAVAPEAVTVNARGAAISHSALTPLLIEAIKELKEQNAGLREEVDALIAEVANLKAAMAKPRVGAARPSGRKA